LFEEALRRSQWCSNDPVCMESPGAKLVQLDRLRVGH
jgi:hypothetical protein